MTLFDLIAAGVIAISALLGFQRGAVRELVGLFAFGLSAIAALAALPITRPIAATFFHLTIVAVAVAVILGFAAVYVAFKLIGGWVASQLHQQSVLGGADRALGLGIGAARALILLGLFALVFDRATPTELKPSWISNAFLYPLASASGRLIGKLAPSGLKMFGHSGALLNGQDSPDTDQSSDPEEPRETGAPPAPPPKTPPAPAHASPRKGKGYDRRSRDQLDTLVERTR